jgi:tetratricopeptide (TPR) repeat protein
LTLLLVSSATLYKRSLAILEKALGPDHPNVATALNNLALLYKNQGRYADAEPLYKAIAGDPGESARSRPSRRRDGAEQPRTALRPPGPLRRRRAALQAIAGDLGESARS